MENKSLKTLLDERKNLENDLLQAYGEISPEQEQALMEVNFSVPAKIDSYCHLIDRLELDAEYFKKQADKYSNAAKQISRLNKKLLDNIRHQMIQNNLTEISGNEEKFKIQKRSSLVIETEEFIPRSFFFEEISSKLDRSKFKEFVESGQTVPGVYLVPTVTRSLNKERK